MAKRSNGALVVGAAAVIGVAAFFLWGSTGTRIQDLQVAFSAFSKNIKFKFPYLIIGIDIQLTNPNAKPILFQEINCDVIINSKKVAVLAYATPVTLAGKASTTLKSIAIQTELFSATDALMNKNVLVNFKGYIKADNFKFPVNETLNIQ
jgi:hypothetical protein